MTQKKFKKRFVLRPARLFKHLVLILVAFIYLLVRPNKYTGINEVSIDTKKLTANK